MSRLDEAVIDIEHATDNGGRKVILCERPYVSGRVRLALHGFAANFKAETIWPGGGEEPACRNLALLATLMAEHLLAERKK